MYIPINNMHNNVIRRLQNQQKYDLTILTNRINKYDGTANRYIKLF